jgi:hypothetical protein
MIGSMRQQRQATGVRHTRQGRSESPSMSVDFHIRGAGRHRTPWPCGRQYIVTYHKIHVTFDVLRLVFPAGVHAQRWFLS